MEYGEEKKNNHIIFFFFFIPTVRRPCLFAADFCDGQRISTIKPTVFQIEEQKAKRDITVV